MLEHQQIVNLLSLREQVDSEKKKNKKMLIQCPLTRLLVIYGISLSLQVPCLRHMMTNEHSLSADEDRKMQLKDLDKANWILSFFPLLSYCVKLGCITPNVLKRHEVH